MDDRTVSPSGIPSEVYGLLAQANLLRMRGCWEEAIENCMAALRLSPDSHSAQSLLGDIYENQGRRDDAIQWYRMALDLNPQSPADHVKLGRLLDLQRQGSSRFEALEEADVRCEAPVEAPAKPEDAGVGLRSRPRMPLPPETVLRIAALTAALLVLVIIVFAYVAVHRRTTLSALGLGPSRDVETPLVVVPSTVTPPSVILPTGNPRDASEQALLDALRSSPVLTSSGIEAYDAQSDPRTSRLTLTFGVPPGQSGGQSRETILRLALQLVQAAAALPAAQSASVFTVRCLLPSPNGGSAPSASLVFVGDAPREAIPPAAPPDSGLSAPAAQGIFGSPWWSPQLPN